jgi:hypothetical protein
MSTGRLPIATLTKRELESKWKDLLGATLEAWAHMILYVRRVYPVDSFGPSPTTAPFGLRLHVNRHPAVAAYIADAIRVALPSLTTSPRVADAITLTILDTNPPLVSLSPEEEERPRYDVLSQSHLALMDVDDDEDDEDENRLGQASPPDHDHPYQPQDQQHQVDEIIQPEPLVLEKYELRFPQEGRPGVAGGHGRHDKGRYDDKGMINSGNNNATSHTNNDKTLFSLSAIDYLEREMRSILLSVYAMQEDYVTDDNDDDVDDKMSSESLSFTISLHIPQANATCDVLDRAMATGEWRSPPNGVVVPHHHPHHDAATSSHQQDHHRRTTTTTDQKIPYVMRPLHTMDATTSPVGPVQFVVKYPRPVGRRRRRPAAASAALRKQADSGDGGGWKRHKRDTSSRGDNNHNLTQDSTGTQSTPTLDF